MKNPAYFRSVVDAVTAQLAAQNIDVFVILTSEGSDEMTTTLIPGVGTVGAGAFLFTKDGRRFSLSTSIDAQDIEESGLFDRCIHYTNFYASLHELWTELAPRRAAFNFSRTEALCDGLTVGRYKRFRDAVADLPAYEAVSSALFIPAVRRAVDE